MSRPGHKRELQNSPPERHNIYPPLTPVCCSAVEATGYLDGKKEGAMTVAPRPLGYLHFPSPVMHVSSSFSPHQPLQTTPTQGDFARLQIEAWIRKTSSSPAKMVSTSEDLIERHGYTLSWAIHRCFNTKPYADVTIRLGDVELPAHGIVLASQSEYFKKALELPMKEGIERKFEFSEGSMHAHWRMFEYIYRGEYIHDAAPPLGLIADDEDLLKDVRVFQLADYFQIDNLRNYAYQHFRTRIKKLWVAENFVDCVRDVYGIPSNVSYALRIEVAKIALKHLSDLWDKKTFRTLIREGGDFVIDILKDIAASK